MANLKHKRRSLALLAVLSLVGAALSLTLSHTLPLDVPRVPSQETAQGAGTSEDAGPELPSLERLERLSKIPLRRQLFEPPPTLPAPKPPERRKPPPAVKLLGTILSTREPVAMISARDRGTELKRVGERVGVRGNEAVIVSIERSRVTLEHEGRTVELEVEEGGAR